MNSKKKSLLSVFLVAVLIITGLPMASGFAAFADDNISATDWMAKIPDNAYLNSLNIPGTHDSGMFMSSATTASYALTQYTSITGQLRSGARIFDIRLRYGGNNRCVICHGQGEAFRYDAEYPFSENLKRFYKNSDGDSLYTYDMVLLEIADYLKDHGGETVILTVQHEHDADDSPLDTDSAGYDQDMYTALDAAEKELSDILAQRGKKIIRYKKSERMSIPLKMGEARGNVVIFEYGMGFGDLMPNERNNYEFTFAEKWNVILPYFDSAPDQHITERKSSTEFRAAYTSSTGQKAYDRDGRKINNNVSLFGSKKYVLPTPAKEGESMRKLLLNYSFEKGAYYGWVSMDFVDRALAKKIYETNDFAGTGQRVKNPTFYLKEIRGFLDDDYDDAIEECLNQGYTILVGKKSDGRIFRDVNPNGDPIVIGYKVSTDPNDAIRDIVGSYDDKGPSGYTKVLVDNSVYNYFTRLSGSKSKNTYIFYTKSSSKSPITTLELLDNRNGSEMVKVKDSNDIFNIQEGFDFFYGLNVVREQKVSLIGTPFSGGNIIILIAGIIVLIAAIVVVAVIRKRKAVERE